MPKDKQTPLTSGSQKTTRLNKFLAENVGISRREADDLIVAKKVKVNGEEAILGTRIDEAKDNIEIDGTPIAKLEQKTYIILNKPVGYVSSRKQQGDTPTLYDILPEKYKNLKTVGRLDKESSGLILVTNDGDFAFEMTHPKFVKKKIYKVELETPLAPIHQQIISDFGIDLPDGKSQLFLTSENPEKTKFQVEMSEGRNRQIRRTFAALGYKVKKLHRTHFGKYALGNLRPGEFIEITEI